MKLLPFYSLFKRRLNSVLAFILTVQIFDHLFVQNFEEKLRVKIESCRSHLQYR